MNKKYQLIIGVIIALVTVFLIGCQTSQELKEGTYTSKVDSKNFSFTLYDGNHYTVKIDNETVVEGVYEVKNEQVYITDETGPYACGENMTGVYKWVIKDNKVTFTAIKDECGGRKNFMTSNPFKIK